ncbi:hypothetical protein ACJX0J_023736, partial [Zea mays]
MQYEPVDTWNNGSFKYGMILRMLMLLICTRMYCIHYNTLDDEQFRIINPCMHKIVSIIIDFVVGVKKGVVLLLFIEDHNI